MSGCEPGASTELRSAAIRLLARREYSRVELQIKLGQRGFDEHFVKLFLDDLENQNLLSDERFARSLISTRSRTGYGPNRISLELADRGVAEDIIRDAMEQAEIDWNQCGVELAIKKFGIDRAQDFPDWARRARYLERRGFDLQSIQFAIGNFEAAPA